MTQFEKLQNNVIKKIHFLQCRYSKTTANPMAIEEGKDNAAQKLFNKLNATSQAKCYAAMADNSHKNNVLRNRLNCDFSGKRNKATGTPLTRRVPHC